MERERAVFPASEDARTGYSLWGRDLLDFLVARGLLFFLSRSVDGLSWRGWFFFFDEGGRHGSGRVNGLFRV